MKNSRVSNNVAPSRLLFKRLPRRLNKMPTQCVTNLTLVDPLGPRIEGASLSFEDGVIRGRTREGDVILDGEGELLALPGFIDIHTHGANGCDFTAGTLEAVTTIAEAKLKEGVTTFLPTTWTETPECLTRMAQAAAEYQSMGQPFARTPFLHVEGPYLNPAQAGAQDPDLMRPPSVEEITALHQICPIGLISVAPEREGMIDFIKIGRAHV